MIKAIYRLVKTIVLAFEKDAADEFNWLDQIFNIFD